MYTIIPLLLAHIQELNNQILFLFKFIVKNIPLNRKSPKDDSLFSPKYNKLKIDRSPHCGKALVLKKNCIKPFVDFYDYKPTNFLSADETYTKVKGAKRYVWFIMDAIKKSILGYIIYFFQPNHKNGQENRPFVHLCPPSLCPYLVLPKAMHNLLFQQHQFPFDQHTHLLY